MSLDSPVTQADIVAALGTGQRDVAAFFNSLTDDEFVLRDGAAWTPAEHFHHLNTTISAVARGLSVPRWLLRLRFGRARVPSCAYDELRDVYLAHLAAGAGASQRFVPPREELSGTQIAERRAERLARWERVNARLHAALARWSERDLDRIRLPHPILGLITARELLFFTVYHNHHHIAAARRRLPRFNQ